MADNNNTQNVQPENGQNTQNTQNNVKTPDVNEQIKNRMDKLKTLQETYQLLEQTDIDLIFEVLCISYNKANKVNMSQDEFAEFLADNNIGFVKMTSIFKDIVEDLMFNGMTPEEVEAQKNALANLMKK